MLRELRPACLSYGSGGRGFSLGRRPTIIRIMDDALVTPNAEFVGNLRHSIRRAQRQLIENPDPTSPWWFLVDPDAPEVDDGVANPWA